MAGRILARILAYLLPAFAASGADIEGLVVVKRRLTRPSVTAPASAYQRGPAVELQITPEDDPLAYERSHVVVYLEGEISSEPAHAAIDQRNRRFHPDLLVVPAGSVVSFPNADPIFHNVFSLSKPKSFDLGNYPKGQARTVAFAKPGIVSVHCRLHPNMAAVVVVTPNQWGVRAQEDGRFRLADVPPGRYTAVAWHKNAGSFRQPVQVTGQGAPRLEFLIPLDEDSARQASR